jgi:predicted RNA-binding Zn-ribbon protein involved in translation (DUF1610 family)
MADEYLKEYNPGDTFLHRVWTTLIAKQDARYAQDTPLACAADNSQIPAPIDPPVGGFVDWNDSDDAPGWVPREAEQLGAPPFFWEGGREHQFRHNQWVQRQLHVAFACGRGVNSKTKGEDNKTGLARAPRLLAALQYQNDRIDSLRDAMSIYFLLELLYRIISAGPSVLGFERLTITPRGKTGAFAKLIQGMFKNFPTFQREASRRVVNADKPLPTFQTISPRNTSANCPSCGGAVDRRGSADWAYCPRCGKVFRSHLGAARNIATLARTAAEEKASKAATEEEAGEIPPS